tara:strand:- start:238 stop:741 length:504 start_codon:yes stop_codon:yes gene_type:complete
MYYYDMDYTELYNLLLEYKWKKISKSTKESRMRNGNFRRDNYSVNVGMVRLYQKGLPIVIGNKMKKNKSAIYNECRRLYPDHEFTGIMINKNFKCPPHKDKGNEGPVVIIGLGDYVGGELVADGIEYDIHNKDLIFEASKIEHYVKEFTGDRYSVVLFKHKTYLCKK